MKLKLYTLFSVLFIVIVGVYVYLNQDAMYTLRLYEYSLEMPVAVWFTIPVVIMYIVSLAHMGFYGFLSYLRKRALEKDIANVKTVVMESITRDLSTTELKHEMLKPIGILLKNSQLTPVASQIATGDTDLDKLLFQIEKLNSNEIADFSQFKLPRTSPLRVRNAAIKLAKDKHYAEEILKKYSNEKFLVDQAIQAFVSYADKKKIEKYKQYLTKEAVIALLARYKAKENPLTFPHEEAVGYIQEVKFNAHDFIAVIKKLKTQVNPEELLELTYEFKNDFPEAIDAWVYINLELERIDEVEDVLESAEDDEFLNFRKYLAVKHAGIKVTLDEFIG